MPVIEVTCSSRVSSAVKRSLAGALPEIVSAAVECAAEPFDGDLQVGDVVLRFHDSGPLDRFDLDVLIDVRSKWFEDRAADRQRRVDEIRDRSAAVLPRGLVVGVLLSLPVAAWAQSS